MVVGGLPEGSKDIAGARAQVAEASADCCSTTRGLRREASRSSRCIRSMRPTAPACRCCREALDLCEAIEGTRTIRGSARCIDVYHVWWDPNLERDIARAGRRSASSASMSATGWCRPRDVLNDRGMMGDGVIDIPHIRGLVEQRAIAGPSKSRSSRRQLVEAPDGRTLRLPRAV